MVILALFVKNKVFSSLNSFYIKPQIFYFRFEPFSESSLNTSILLNEIPVRASIRGSKRVKIPRVS